MSDLACDLEEDFVEEFPTEERNDGLNQYGGHGARSMYAPALKHLNKDVGNADRHDSGISSFGDEYSSNRLDSVNQLFTSLRVTDQTQDSQPNYSDRVISVSLANQQTPSSPCDSISVQSTTESNGVIASNVCTSERFDSGVLNSSSDLNVASVRSAGSLEYVPDASVFHLYEPDEDGDNQVHNSIIQRKDQLTIYIISLAGSYEWLNQSNKLSQTPLHLAVITNQPHVVRRLMVAGAQVDVRDSKGNTPLHIACTKGFTEIVCLLLTPVKHHEIHVNRYDIPYQKLPQDLESRNYDGLGCMHLAALGNHLVIMEMLLKNRANINIADGKSGRTVLHYAAECGNEQLLNFILKEPTTSIDEKTYAGLTAITLAKGRGYLDAVEILFVHGADTSGLEEDSDESDNDMDMMYDDIRIAGEPVTFSCS